MTTIVDFFVERFAVKHAKADIEPDLTTSRDVSGLEAMLDYAIAEGTQMRLSLFVCLLRLARMALKEESAEMHDRAPETRS